MAVTETTTRRDTVVLIGDLAALYERAGTIITRYLERGWQLERSMTEPNQGPKMELRFIRERAEEDAS